MNPETRWCEFAGPAGMLVGAIDEPTAEPRGVAVLCHPHPLFGGTLDNKVVQTVARAAVACGLRAVRFNFRGAGGSAGAWDEGRGEIDDALAVIAEQRLAQRPLVLAGFSFGGHVAAAAAERLQAAGRPVDRLVLIAPATSRFAVPSVPAGTLVIHGEQDDVVPLQATLDWARPQHLPVLVMPGVGHFFHGQLGPLKAAVQHHLARLEPAAPPP